MPICAIFLYFLLYNDVDYFKKSFESDKKEEFIEAVKQIEQIDLNNLDLEFRYYLRKKAIDIFDKTFISSGIFSFYSYYLKSEEERNKEYAYQKAVLNLLNYVSKFPEKYLVEDIFKRNITKNLIIYHTNDVINLIKKYEKKLDNDIKISNSIGLLLKLEKENKISISKESHNYLKNFLFSFYNSSNMKEKCSLLLTDFSVLKENFKNDEEIMKNMRKCICKERYFSGVILYEINLIENKIKGTDSLIKEFIKKEKDLKKKRAQEELFKILKEGKEINYSKFYSEMKLKEIEYSKNKYCKKYIFF